MNQDAARVYAPVLMRMIDVMSGRGGTFGEALTVAAADCGHDVATMPPEVVESILVLAFRIVGSGRIPGAADA